MKRDLNLIRAMLITCERGTKDRIDLMKCPDDFDLDYLPEVIRAHGELIVDAGWAEYVSVKSHYSISYIHMQLNHKGYDVLALMRPEERWETVKPMIENASLDLILEKLELSARMEYLDIARLGFKGQ